MLVLWASKRSVRVPHWKRDPFGIILEVSWSPALDTLCFLNQHVWSLSQEKGILKCNRLNCNLARRSSVGPLPVFSTVFSVVKVYHSALSIFMQLSFTLSGHPFFLCISYFPCMVNSLQEANNLSLAEHEIWRPVFWKYNHFGTKIKIQT